MTPRQKEFVDINHHFMTIVEMADDLKIDHSNIRYYCNIMGYTPITKLQQQEAIIKRYRETKTAHQIAEILNISPQGLYEILKKLNLTILTRGEQLKRNNVQENKQSFLLEAKKKAFIQEFFDEYGINNTGNIKRVKDVYNQTGSVFLDELRGITTTVRNKKLLSSE